MNVYLIFATFSAVLGLFQLGYNASSMNQPHFVIEMFLNKTFEDRYSTELTTESVATYFSIAVTIFSVGGMIGALSAGRLGEKLGRRNALLYTQSFSIIGALLQGLCKYVSSYEMLLLGRLLAGVSNGVFEGISTLYLVEIAPTNVRGAVGTLNALGYTIGILTGTILGLSNVLGGEETWPILLALPLVPSILQVLILPFMPETPRYLFIAKREFAQAEEALIKLRNTENVDQDLMSLQMEEQAYIDDTNYTIFELLLSSTYHLPLFVGAFLHLSKSLTGYTAFRCYSTRFFSSVGLDDQISEYLTIALSVAGVLATMVTIPLMDRAGRRTLQLTGLGGIVFSFMMITAGLNLNKFIDKILVVLFSLTFVVFCKIGPGTIPWVATGELFIQGPRAAANSVCIFLNWAGGMIVAIVFPQLMNYAFNFSLIPFIVLSLIFFVIQIVYFPETKNISPRELDRLFQMPNAWKTAIGFVRLSVRRRRSRRKTTEKSFSKSQSHYGSISESVKETNPWGTCSP